MSVVKIWMSVWILLWEMLIYTRQVEYQDCQRVADLSLDCSAAKCKGSLVRSVALADIVQPTYEGPRRTSAKCDSTCLLRALAMTDTEGDQGPRLSPCLMNVVMIISDCAATVLVASIYHTEIGIGSSSDANTISQNFLSAEII